MSAVPTGTGFLVVSNDTTPFAHNIARGNDTFGFALVDQVIAEFGPPFSADESVDENYVFNNVFTGNGTNPDLTRSPVGADTVFLATQSSNNCQSGNTFATDVGLAALPVCTLPPPAFASCPAPSVP